MRSFRQTDLIILTIFVQGDKHHTLMFSLQQTCLHLHHQKVQKWWKHNNLQTWRRKAHTWLSTLSSSAKEIHLNTSRQHYFFLFEREQRERRDKGMYTIVFSLPSHYFVYSVIIENVTVTSWILLQTFLMMLLRYDEYHIPNFTS